MDNADNLLGDFASGDSAPAPLAPQVVPAPSLNDMKRDHDSTDDFEHLEGEGKREEAGEVPGHLHGAARVASQNFLDMERDEFMDTARVPSVTEKLVDHLADKFTDSESEGTAGESPMHRPDPSAPPAVTTSTFTSSPFLPEPVQTPTLISSSVALSQPERDTPKSATALEPIVTPTPAVKPVADLVTEIKPQPKPEPPAHLEAAVLPKPAALTKPAEPSPEPVKPEAPQEPQRNLPEPKKEPEPVPEPARAPTAHVIEAEVIFCQMGLVESLVYWRKPAQSGAALGGGLALLVALACCSVVSVLAYSSLLVLSAAVAFRIYKNVLQAVQKTSEGHPFKWLLEKDISVPAERAQALAAAATAHLNAAASELRRLFLVEDLVDSLKFGVLLWCLTYVGACFNGITLIILGWIALFTLPKAYEMNKPQVDANLELARAKINDITAKVRAAVPLGRKTESDKDK